MKKTHSRFRDAAITLGILCACFAAGVLMDDYLHIDEHVTTVTVFGVFLISLLTDGYFYGILASIAGTLVINYAFTFPYFSFNFIIPSNLFSGLVMIALALCTGALTTKIKRQEAMRAEGEMERMRANLLRAVSHDLRTPLTTIYGSASALEEQLDTLSDAQKRQMLKGIREDADWLVQMVENLLSVTRIDTGRVKIEKVPIALDELMDSVVRKFRSRCPGQSLDLSIPQELVLIPMDPILIQQVLLNLLENAVRHAQGMTALSLRVSVSDGRAVFQVRDDGCGIREDLLPRILTGNILPEDTPADHKKRSAGIGLSVCATIVRAHGGTISAGNHPDGGAVFSFTLDLEEETHE